MNPHVYIFDTDPEYSALLKGICGTTDLSSTVFNTPTELLQQIPQEGILVLDIKMSFCDGLEIIKNLARSDNHLKLILMSSYDAGVLKGAKQLALSCGFHVCACLRKPVLVSSFRDALEQAVCSVKLGSSDNIAQLQVC